LNAGIVKYSVTAGFNRTATTSREQKIVERRGSCQAPTVRPAIGLERRGHSTKGGRAKMKLAAKHANVRNGVHILRHTFCSNLAMRGCARWRDSTPWRASTCRRSVATTRF